MSVHPTAQVDPDAVIDRSAAVGPFAVIHDDVEIGAGCVIGAYVEIRHARIGDGTRIGSQSIIGGDPQMLDWQDVPSLVRIGRENDIREMVTIHRSKDEGGETVIGDRTMIMTNTHVGHDCIVGDEAIITTYAGLSGHVTVGSRALIGGHTGIHQFVRIGDYAMVGGMTRIVQDVAPFMLAEGNPAFIRGTNAVGLKRRGFSATARANIKEAFRMLFREGKNMKSAREALTLIKDEDGEIGRIIAFVDGSKRGLTGGAEG